MDCYLGIDVGSVSTNLALIDENSNLVDKLYIRTLGQPINVVNSGLKTLLDKYGEELIIGGVGTTGSGRQLASIMVGADVQKNEITAHAVAALHACPEVRTVFEIGGQDSKIIIIRNGIVSDFAMNTVCAAGTGSFLDRQAGRLNIPIEKFGEYALRSKTAVRIAGRCAVFAESDMIHKQQSGHSTEDIINGLCEALVRNYLNNLGKGKHIEPPIVFQGGVAANIGIVKAFEKELGMEIIVPRNYDVMGAIGAAMLAREEKKKTGTTRFLGFGLTNQSFITRSFECDKCSNKCEVVEFLRENTAVARSGDRCGRWSGENLNSKRENSLLSADL
jgi:predicted CoA-substrate-specific enzyme activase